MIAFLGTGLLGSGFVRAALKRGDAVQVWNRTMDKTKPLQAEGARAFVSAAEAVRGAEYVHLVLSDDSAVETVLEMIRPALAPNSVVIDHTTTSVAGARQRTARLAATGIIYQHCPVFMAPLNALESTGVMLISGEPARYESLRAHLEPMTGKLVYFGEDAGRGAAMKLSGNLMLMAVTTGLADAAAFLKGLDIPRTELNKLFENFNPGMSVQPRAKRMLSGEHTNPSWELKMSRKDARLILEEGHNAVPPLAMVQHYAEFMDKWIQRGFAEADWTVIGKDAL